MQFSLSSYSPLSRGSQKFYSRTNKKKNYSWKSPVKTILCSTVGRIHKWRTPIDLESTTDSIYACPFMLISQILSDLDIAPVYRYSPILSFSGTDNVYFSRSYFDLVDSLLLCRGEYFPNLV